MHKSGFLGDAGALAVPRATVRLQLHREFDFDDAAGTVDYYAALGISHFYVSPIFRARPGSTHGYDVVDPCCINPELGGEEGLLRLVAQLRAAGMGLVIDIVPNHMGVAPGTNAYWESVLQWGPRSPYVEWFDIDWNSPVPHLHGKVLLPVLGDLYDKVLCAGQLRLESDPARGMVLAYHDNRFPLSPATFADVLKGQALFAELAASLESSGPEDLYAAVEQLNNLTESVNGQKALQMALDACDPTTDQGRKNLHELLDRQHYRLSWWRNAAEEINWRRFFEVSDLAGVRVELESVFEATHALTFDLYRRGLIDGVRVDHVDGLAHTAAYCTRLRERLAGLQSGRPAHLARQPAWIVVEKILTPGESLPDDWQIDGTTGYDFMDQAGAVLHDGDGERTLRRLWAELTDDQADFEAHIERARRQLLAENFVGELDALAQALHRYATCEPPRGRDLALPAIRRVLVALLTSFRRYRCYSAGGMASAEDQRVLQEATVHAQTLLRLPDHDLLRKVAGWLGLDDGKEGGTPGNDLRERAITRFQQLTPPLAAKSVEDTAFYRYAPLLSRNDVGSYPSAIAPGIDAFHDANRERAAHFPHAMLATATHDHKRGEDVRARLAALTEMPALWGDTLRQWSAAHGPGRSTIAAAGGKSMAAPLPADEIMLYQAMLGAWPAGLAAGDASGVTQFAERIAAWQQKSLREAKQRSSWMQPDEAYEAACRKFLDALISGPLSQTFLPQLVEWVERLGPAARANSLTQTLLRLTSPGVPDLYQGCDLADFSLVDPDNRRPVDMETRRASLAAQPGDKQRLIRAVLDFRRKDPGLFADGDYLPLTVSGTRQAHVIAFARRLDNRHAITVALRLPSAMLSSGSLLADHWDNTCIQVPPELKGPWRDVVGGGQTADDTPLLLSHVLADSPVALLVSETE